MIRKLLTTTAVAALLTAGSIAGVSANTQDMADGKPVFTDEAGEGMNSDTGYFQAEPGLVLASGLIGQSVYNSGGQETENIGEINDIVMGPNGDAEAVIVSVGGFLGMGGKEVAVDFDKVSWAERDGERWLVLNASKEELESAPEFDRTAMAPERPDEQISDEQTSMDDTGESTETTDRVASTETGENAAEMEENASAADENAPMDATSPGEDSAAMEDEAARDQTAAADDPDAAIDRENETAAINLDSWDVVDDEQLSAETLIGTRVYGANNTDIGEIGDVIVTGDGSLEAFVVDVGGFLGIGEKPVALDANELRILRNDNDNLRIFTEYTQEQLESQAAYTEEAYQKDRDSVLLR